MTKLSVNINKIATLRNARGGNNPNLLQVALDCERFGAEGITVHPRPDERHIKFSDVYDLKKHISTELNIEGNPTPEFLKLVEDIMPAQVTLVPDAPDALTSNAGWDTIKNYDFLEETIKRLKSKGIRTSIFVNPIIEMVQGAYKVGADRIELYTEPYAEEFHQNNKKAILPYEECSKTASALKLGVNAGHDLSLDNLKYFSDNLQTLDEVSIGHALVCDALYLGLEKTIKSYLDCLKK